MQYNHHPIMTNNSNHHHHMMHQFNAMQQQMQLNHQQQLRDLEFRFDQKLQQNTAALSQLLATTLGATIKQLLQQNDAATITSGSSSTVNLIDMESVNQTKPPQKMVQFHSNPIQTSSPYHYIQDQPIPNQEHASSSPTNTQELAKLLLAAKEPKLYFPSYKPTANYDNWKMLCILKTSKHNVHRVLVVINDNGSCVFDPNMNNEHSSTLFMLMMEALALMLTS
jgi:hypothetical protein